MKQAVAFGPALHVSGEPAPARFEEVPEEIVAGADLAIDGGALNGLPSTVVDLTGVDGEGTWKVLREGAMTREELKGNLSGLADRH